MPGDTNGTWDVFAYDRMAATCSRWSIDAVGAQSNGPSFNPSINSNGTVTAFDSYATNLVAGDTNGRDDVFVMDQSAGWAVERVSTTQGGVQGYAGNSFQPAVSADGAYVAYTSLAWDLFFDDFNAGADIVLHTRASNAMVRVKGVSDPNGWSLNPGISADGRYVCFTSDSSNLITGDTNGSRDVFRYDRQDGSVTRISVTQEG